MLPSRFAKAPLRDQLSTDRRTSSRCSTVFEVRSSLTARADGECVFADERGLSMAEAPACYSCSVTRLLRDVSPVTPGYEIRSFEYPKCRTVLRSVSKSDPDWPEAAD